MDNAKARLDALPQDVRVLIYEQLSAMMLQAKGFENLTANVIKSYMMKLDLDLRPLFVDCVHAIVSGEFDQSKSNEPSDTVLLPVICGLLVKDLSGIHPDTLLLTLDLPPSQYGKQKTIAKITITQGDSEAWIAANMPNLKYIIGGV